MSNLHLLGIRHHGPGSARNVRDYLEALKPDIVLVEGPPEANELLKWSIEPDMKPPVALLVYRPDNPQQAVFYPFAEFSPEWQAITYAVQNKIHVRFIDMPLTHKFALQEQEQENAKTEPADELSRLENSAEVEEDKEAPLIEKMRRDPISHLAEAAGFSDGERWWESMFEQRNDGVEIFTAVAEAMTVLREAFPEKGDRKEKIREAFMRNGIRQAEREMFQEIAVICGAWHVPALQTMPKAKDDVDLLKNLPKVKAECTWIPWTYSRLTFQSGYGAGIHSPGWYHHLWNTPEDKATRWMSHVARLFRTKQIDTSVAHVVEAVRLAEALAAMRGLAEPGLEELNEATLTVLCNGESILLQFVDDDLVVSNRMGEVPTAIPKPPLQLDLEKRQKSLRLPAEIVPKEYVLDLRKDTDLERSILLHRLVLLDIPWGRPSYASGKGTFKEAWSLKWEPEYSISLIEKGALGNTVEEAANHHVVAKAEDTGALKDLGILLEQTVPAELPRAVEQLLHFLDNKAAATGDVMQLMGVLAPLVGVSRYGNVRNTDATLLLKIVNSLIARICISLPATCTLVDEEAAVQLLESFFSLNESVALLQQEEQKTLWNNTLQVIAQANATVPLLGGYSTRLLNDAKLLSQEEITSRFARALSPSSPPAQVAAWLEGFLKGSGTILLLDEDLWNLINNWFDSLEEDIFMEFLPVMRRTFSQFSAPEKRKLGEKAKGGGKGNNTLIAISGFDEVRAAKGLPVIAQWLGLKDILA